MSHRRYGADARQTSSGAEPPICIHQCSIGRSRTYGARVLTHERCDLFEVSPLVICEPRDEARFRVRVPSLDAGDVTKADKRRGLAPVQCRDDRNVLAHPIALSKSGEAAREIVIPATAKQEIRDKLDQAGITERTIYPGADGIARWLSRYYRPARLV